LCSLTAFSIWSFSLIAEDKRMHSKFSKIAFRVFALAFAALLPVALAAQVTATSTGKTSAEDSPSRWDIFAGYSYLGAKGNIDVLQYDGTTVSERYSAADFGVIASGAYYFNKYVGAQVEGASHGQWTDSPESNDQFATVAGGLIVRYPGGDIEPFAHALVGTADVSGPEHEPMTWGVALTVGGGVDYPTPFFNHRLAIRVFQADFEYIHDDFGTGVWRGRANIDAPRLSTGLVYHVGSIAPPPPVTLACSASPETIFPGDPVTVTATAGSLNPKLNVVYTWAGTGVTGNGATATVATGSLAAGTYTVNCGVKEGRPGKEGLKPWESAEATATFTVKAFEPPTVSCSASPSTIKPGETSTITSSGLSPQNRPLTYSYSAASGAINGGGTSAVFSSTGAPTGVVGITCNVSDDKGQTATSNTSVTITAPYVAPIPHTQALCSISFEKDAQRPTRVDNEAKACLDEVALDLQKQPDAKAVVVGELNGQEKEKIAKEENFAAKHKHAKVEDFAGERAVNTKEYLVTEKGVDASRVSVATGATDGQTVEDYLVPSGATFSADVQGTTAVDETVVKPEVRKPLGEKHHHKKAAEAATK
jgi:hypothetical protein